MTNDDYNVDNELKKIVSDAKEQYVSSEDTSGKKTSEFEMFKEISNKNNDFNLARNNLKKIREQLENKIITNEEESFKDVQDPPLDEQITIDYDIEEIEKQTEDHLNKTIGPEQKNEFDDHETSNKYDFLCSFKDNIEKSYLELMKKQQYIEHHGVQVDSRYNSLVNKQKNISQVIKEKESEYLSLLKKEKELEYLRLKYNSDYIDLGQKCNNLEKMMLKLDDNKKIIQYLSIPGVRKKYEKELIEIKKEQEIINELKQKTDNERNNINWIIAQQKQLKNKLPSEILEIKNKKNLLQTSKTDDITKKEQDEKGNLGNIHKPQENIGKLNVKLEKTDDYIENFKRKKAMKQLKKKNITNPDTG